MRTPPPGGTLIKILESTSPLLKCHNADRWPRIGEKRKRQTRTPTQGGTLIKLLEYTSLLLK